MWLQGVPIRRGAARGPVAIDLGPSYGTARRAVVAAFGEIALDDPRVSGPPDWLAVSLASIPEGTAVLPSGGPPTVGGIDLDLLRAGEVVRLDGGRGAVELPGVTEVKVVTSFLERPDGRVLLLRRSEKVGSFQGRWAAVSGFLEDPTPEDQARREIREETGVEPSRARLETVGRLVYVRNEMTVFTVHPFRFRVPELAVTLDWEHTESEWVDPSEIARRETVPKLDRVWRSVAGRESPARRRPSEDV